MIGQYTITFREVLEAALITGIILAYLQRTKKDNLSRFVWYGIIAAVIASVAVGFVIVLTYGGLDEASQKLFEGCAALIAVAVLTSMILWMAFKGKNIKGEVDGKVEKAVETGTSLSLIGLGFVVVFREGFETVLFLTPMGASDINATIMGATLGLASSLFLAFLIYKVGLKIDLKRFFYFSSLLLILLAAGLAGYGIHELIEWQEATGGNPGWWGAIAYDLGIESTHLLGHKGAIGSIFAVMFGYSVKMEWGRVIVHAIYLVIFIPITVLAYKKPEFLDVFTKMVAKIKSLFIPFEDIPGQKENNPNQRIQSNENNMDQTTTHNKNG